MRWVTVVLVVLGVGLAAPARADSDADKAARLFKEGRDAVAAGKLDEACAKFAASYKLDAAIGTKLNLADCLEQKGQIAAAYKLFDEAAVEAAKGGKEGRESFARQRADKLVKQLVQVEIVVAEPDTEGMTVVVGGAIVVKKEWSAPRVLAPGKIRVNVSAPGRVPFETAIDGHAGEVRKVEVPALAKAETTTGAGTGTGTDTGAGTGTGTDTGAGPGTGTGGGGDGGPAPEGKRPSRKLAYVVGGGGVVLLGTSLALGLAAKSKFDGAECGTSAGLPDGVCTDAGQKTTNSARRLADIGTGVAIAGAVAVGVGVWLFVRARHHHAASDHVVVSPTVSDDGVGVVVTWSR